MAIVALSSARVKHEHCVCSCSGKTLCLPADMDTWAYRPLKYERVYLPLCNVVDTPFYIQGGDILVHNPRIRSLISINQREQNVISSFSATINSNCSRHWARSAEAICAIEVLLNNLLIDSCFPAPTISKSKTSIFKLSNTPLSYTYNRPTPHTILIAWDGLWQSTFSPM